MIEMRRFLRVTFSVFSHYPLFWTLPYRLAIRVCRKRSRRQLSSGTDPDDDDVVDVTLFSALDDDVVDVTLN